MADPPRSATPDFYSILGITTASSIKEICKAYKSIVTKWNPDKKEANDINEAYGKAMDGKRFDEDEALTISEPTTVDNIGNYKSVEDPSLFSGVRDDEYSVHNINLSRNTSRRCKTPNPRSSSSSMSKSESTRSKTPITSASQRRRHRSTSGEVEFLVDQPPAASASAFNPRSRRCTSETHIQMGTATATATATATTSASSLSKNASRRSASTPIVFSQSTARKKPAPVEMKIECTLEELLEGCLKKIKITRDVIAETGIIVQEEETLWVNVKPGWKKGTKITFEGKGDEKPGYLPADLILSIDERRHPLFEREGDDLEIFVEIPLVNALTGCSIPIPLLGGDKMTLSFDDIIYHGYEKLIRGQGMPNPKQQSRRGDLRIKFLVEFPTELSDEQRAEAVRILQHCS